MDNAIKISPVQTRRCEPFSPSWKPNHLQTSSTAAAISLSPQAQSSLIILPTSSIQQLQHIIGWQGFARIAEEVENTKTWQESLNSPSLALCRIPDTIRARVGLGLEPRLGTYHIVYKGWSLTYLPLVIALAVVKWSQGMVKGSSSQFWHGQRVKCSNGGLKILATQLPTCGIAVRP